MAQDQMKDLPCLTPLAVPLYSTRGEETLPQCPPACLSACDATICISLLVKAENSYFIAKMFSCQEAINGSEEAGWLGSSDQRAT